MARIREVGSRGKLSVEFNSVPEVFRIIDKLGWVPQNSKSSDERGHGDGFNTFGSLNEAKDVFLNHPEKIRQFSVNDDKLQRIESPGKDVWYDVTGDYLDIDKFLEGEPESFGNSVMGNPKSIFCTINVLDSMVWNTHKDYAIAKQKRILRLVDWLETQDIRCQIVLSSDSSVMDSSIIVKEFQDPFDLNHLAVALHPDFFRRILFLIMEQSKTWSYGYGSGMEYDERMKQYKPNPEDGLYVYVGGYIPFNGDNHGIDKLEKAFDKIEKNIATMIDEGRTFCEEPLVIKGGKDW